MALHGVLSAMREILLDLEEIPIAEETRRTVYRERFTELSEEELEDLVKIPPEKFGIYKQTIFRKEASVLRIHFKVSLAMVQAHYREVTGERYQRVRFMRALHNARPWQDNSTVSLAENFRAYLTEDMPEFVSLAPALKDMLELEFANMLIKRLPDSALDPDTRVTETQLVDYTVAELLQLSYAVPPSVQCRSFDWDVMTAMEDFYEAGQKLPADIAFNTVVVAGGREEDQFPGWAHVGETLFRSLTETPRDELFPLTLLAEAVTADIEGAESEEELFRQFMEKLVELLRSGVLTLHKPK